MPNQVIHGHHSDITIAVLRHLRDDAAAVSAIASGLQHSTMSAITQRMAGYRD
jgi:hypothetical protein